MYRPVTISLGELQGTTSLQKILDFEVLCLEVNLVAQTFETCVKARLGGVVLTYNGLEGSLKLLESVTASTEHQRDTLAINYTYVSDVSLHS